MNTNTRKGLTLAPGAAGLGLSAEDGTAEGLGPSADAEGLSADAEGFRAEAEGFRAEAEGLSADGGLAAETEALGTSAVGLAAGGLGLHVESDWPHSAQNLPVWSGALQPGHARPGAAKTQHESAHNRTRMAVPEAANEEGAVRAAASMS
jgi:hypothetical protein